MTDAEKGKCRAQGALDKFLETMALETRDRSQEYQTAFWAEIHHCLRDSYIEEYK